MGGKPGSGDSPAPKTVVEIDGARFSNLHGFYDEVGEHIIPGASWGRNLDAFNDILRGGFGTPDGGFVLRWRNHAMSRERLGHAETVRQLARGMLRCHHSSIPKFREDLAAAMRGEGSTVYDWLVEIIQVHCAGGEEEEDGVELVLD